MNEQPHPEQVHIERMTLRDLDKVLAIERDCFPSPWSEDSFRQEIIDRERSIPLTASIDGQIIGYSVAWFVVDEIHIGNIAVHHDHRRRGIGELMLRTLLERGIARECRLATLEVRQTNRAAIELYRKFGFLAIAQRKGYYIDTGDNAIVMIRILDQEVQPHRRHHYVPDANCETEEWNGLRK